MGLLKCKDIIYERPWGKHKNGIVQFVYNSGSYGTEQKILEGKIISQKVIDVPGGDHEYYAEKNNYNRKGC